MKKLCMIFAAAAALTACGGSSSGGSAQGSANAFLAEVTRVVGTTSESTDAIDIDAVVVLAPEDAEPLALN